MRHPNQPVYDDNGVMRFNKNAIVRFLLDFCTGKGIGMNELAIMPFSNEDRSQFAQLIGYSLAGYKELSYVTDEMLESLYPLEQKGAPEKEKADISSRRFEISKADRFYIEDRLVVTVTPLCGYEKDLLKRLLESRCPSCRGSGLAPYVGGDDKNDPECSRCLGTGFREMNSPTV